MNRWQIYNLLKSMEPPTIEMLGKIENTDSNEVKEGLLEWLEVLSKDKYQQDRVKAIKEELQRSFLK